MSSDESLSLKTSVPCFLVLWQRSDFKVFLHFVSNVYNVRGRVILNIQSRAEDEWLYIEYNTDVNVVNNL